MSGRLQALNASAVRRNVNADRNINQSIRRLRERLGSAPKPKQRVRKARAKPDQSTQGWSLTHTLYVVLIFILIGLIAYLVYQYLNKPDYSDDIEQRLIKRTKEMIERRMKNAPKGLVDIPRQMGAPISVEEQKNSAGNPYLYLYGSPDSPGFASYPGHRPPGYRHMYTAWGRNPGETIGTQPYYSSWERYNKPQSYVVQESSVNYPRSQLNEYVEEQNRYIKKVNDRVRQINEQRMFSPRFLRHSAELSEIRNFERRLANKVHRESEDQPHLPDMEY